MSEVPVKEISQLLDELSSKVPKIISGLMDALYSAEAGKKIGQSVGSFYKELVNSGIPAEEALKLAKDYMFSLKDVTNSFGKNNP